MQLTAVTQTEEDVELPIPKDEPKKIPEYGTVEWIHHWSQFEGHLLTPINVSITGSIKYICPELKWYNFEVYPHKIKLTNTGYTVLIGAKWKTERPYLEGGPLLEKHIISQMHFHWGKNMMDGSDHMVDKRKHPAELQVTFFRSEYLTQEEALRHHDGVVVVCFLIKYGVEPDMRLAHVIEGFGRVQEAFTCTRIGPFPMSDLLPMFYEDYFLYWGNLSNAKGENFVVRWLIPRTSLYASMDQMKAFRKLWNPFDEPNNLGNFRPLQETENRHIFFINPHWNQYNSLLPIPRVLPEPSITVLSTKYQAHMWMLPPQNEYMLPKIEEQTKVENPFEDNM